jgi:hypothetical protein
VDVEKNDFGGSVHARLDVLSRWWARNNARLSMSQKYKPVKAYVDTAHPLLAFPSIAPHDSVQAMRLILLFFVLLFAATVSAADAPSLVAQQGRWVCLPDDQTAPQVLVDFEENVYRRCDQNTCVSYDILAVRPHAESTEVSFAPGAIMRADDDGSRYTEILTRGGATITSSGSCTFRGNEPEPDAFEKEELRQRS